MKDVELIKKIMSEQKIIAPMESKQKKTEKNVKVESEKVNKLLKYLNGQHQRTEWMNLYWSQISQW